MWVFVWLSAAGCLKARAGFQESCAFNDECIAPQVCAGRRCRAPCRTDRDCTADWRCASSGQPNVRVCLAPGQNSLCGSSLDCEDRRTACAPDGECRPQCKTGYDCEVYGLGMTCQAGGFCDRSPCARGLCDDAGRLSTGATDASRDAASPTDRPPLDALDAPGDTAGEVSEDVRAEALVDVSTDGGMAPRVCGLDSDGMACEPGAVGCAVVSVAMGSFFTCATFTGGSVRCWGNNAAGTLGVGTSGTSCFFPGLIPRFGMVTSVALGGFFACAGRGDATVWCWGNNSSGQLGTGIGTPAMATTPMRNLALGGTVYAGYDHSCVVLPSGEVQCWGSNSYGQLGGGGLARMPQYFSPIRAFVGSVRALALGQGHSCALYATGTVGCWGNNTDGQAGQPASTMELRDATAVPGLNDVQKLVAGWIFTCALGRDGQVRCWGSNDSGELGRGALTPTRDGTPGVVVGLTDVTDLSAAGAGVCALRRDGTVWCWGRAEVATSTMDPTVPSRVPGLTGVQALWGRCAWLGGADLRCWGPNPGDGTANAMGRVATVRW